MTESNKQSDSQQPENNGLALKIFQEMCCENCSCKKESESIMNIDNMGREKYWENND